MIEPTVKITVVLLPGMDGTGLLFEPFVAALGVDLQVKIVRYPTEGDLGYEELEAAARQQLPSDGQFIVVGESFSGPIAVSLAASQPAGLIGLVLCSSFVSNPRPALGFLRLFTSVFPVKLAPLAALSYFLMGRFSTAALRCALGSALAEVSSSALRARAKAVLSTDVSAMLGTIKIPLLYLLATEDRVVPASACRRIVQILPSTQVVRVEAPHFLLQVAPAAAARTVGTFARQARNIA